MPYYFIGESLGRHLLPGDEGAPDRDVLLIRNGSEFVPLDPSLESAWNKGLVSELAVSGDEDLRMLHYGGVLWSDTEVLTRLDRLRLIPHGVAGGLEESEGGYRLASLRNSPGAIVSPHLFWMWCLSTLSANIQILVELIESKIGIASSDLIAALREDLEFAISVGVFTIDVAIPTVSN